MTLDPVTGLYYARNRNYSPTLGRFISQDPLQYINGANTYQFVMGNPVNRVDPWGRVGVGVIGTGSAGGGLVVGGGATGSVGTGVFVGGSGVSTGGFASGGVAAGGPGVSIGALENTGQTDFFTGGFMGVGGGLFLTNADSVSQLGGPFWQWNLDLEIFSLSFEYSNGIWVCSGTFGPAVGAAATDYSTTTVTGQPGSFPTPGYVTDVNGHPQVVPP
jgi:RHS repeat-associated protein